MRGRAAAAAWLLITLLLLAAGLCLPAQYGETFMGELPAKTALLEETEGKRIILVGGSAAAFGIASEYITEAFPGYTAVNFGLYAAAGTGVMLDLSLPRIREGDIAVLMPEQTAYTLSGDFDASVLWQGLDGHPELIPELSRERRHALLESFPAFAAGKLLRAVTGDLPEATGVYRRASFGACGDVETPLASRNEMPGGFDPTTPIRFPEELPTEDFVREANAWAEAVAARGGEAFFMACPMNAQALGPGEAERMDAFYGRLQDRLSFPLIGNPHESVLDAAWFYDTNFHLNTAGKLVFTRIAAESLRAVLGISEALSMPVPQAPALPGEERFSGDDSCAACFTYEEMGDGLAVTGLTREGREAQVLTVPSRAEGKPVLVLKRGAFSEGRSLREVRIQANIRAVEDGAFAGCGRLRKIVLLQEHPARIRAGFALLEGTEGSLFVPAGTLGAYRTDYTWSVYAGRIREEAPSQQP